MKKAALQICTTVGLIILIAVVSAQAQTQYRVQIPFDFNIGQKSYRSGEYSVGLLSQAADQKVIVIRDAKGRNSYAVMPTRAESGARVDAAKLIFNRYEDQYFLAEITAPAFNAELFKSKMEERIGKNQKVRREQVALAGKN